MTATPGLGPRATTRQARHPDDTGRRPFHLRLSERSIDSELRARGAAVPVAAREGAPGRHHQGQDDRRPVRRRHRPTDRLAAQAPRRRPRRLARGPPRCCTPTPRWSRPRRLPATSPCTSATERALQQRADAEALIGDVSRELLTATTDEVEAVVIGSLERAALRRRRARDVRARRCVVSASTSATATCSATRNPLMRISRTLSVPEIRLVHGSPVAEEPTAGSQRRRAAISSAVGAGSSRMSPATAGPSRGRPRRRRARRSSHHRPARPSERARRRRPSRACRDPSRGAHCPPR